MQTINDIRRDRLLLLIKEHGSQAALARVTGKNPAQISQWVNRSPSSSSGKPRVMDSATARELERVCRKPPGWMDQPVRQDATPPMVAQEPARYVVEPIPVRLARDIVGFLGGLDPLVIPSGKDVIRRLLDGELDEIQASESLARLQAMSAAALPSKRTGTG